METQHIPPGPTSRFIVCVRQLSPICGLGLCSLGSGLPRPTNPVKTLKPPLFERKKNPPQSEAAASATRASKKVAQGPEKKVSRAVSDGRGSDFRRFVVFAVSGAVEAFPER
jgi:hypothetical protein